MTPLPIDPMLPEILARVRDHRRLVLVAAPGAGKTTRVPPALLGAGLLPPEHPDLVLLQPRRVAARASAARIADEQGWALGGRVGYQIRFERRIGPETRLKVVTEGILNRQLVGDPFLDGVGAVILDEFHERSLHTDLALALLREVRDSVRPDLVVVVMSATLDADPVARFLGDAPIVRVPGRTFPVAVSFAGAGPAGLKGPQAIADAVASAVERALAGPGEPGDVLAFLPGVEEIRRAERRLAPWAADAGALVLPLHGSLASDEQDRALRPSDRRKVILATNIAETSLTIDGVTTVVDSGLARVAGYDPARGLDRLELERISRASSDQRAGRAGRTAPGRCVRLWTEAEHRGLPESDRAEVRRVDLAVTVLALRAWGVADPAAFGWFEAPEPASLDAAERLLVLLGAIAAEHGPITPLGHQLLAIPAHPRLGRLLVAAAALGIEREGAALAALLAEKDILARSFGREARPDYHAESDLLVRLDRLHAAERARFAPSLRDSGIDPAAARQAARIRDDLLRVARRLPGPPRSRETNPTDIAPADDADLLRLVLLAYPDRVVRRRGKTDATGVMVGGRGVRLDPESVVRDAEFFLALDPRDDRRGAVREAKVRIASAIDVDWLDDLFPGAVRREQAVVFDPERRRAVGVVARRYLDLTLHEDRGAPAPADQASAALVAEFAPEGRAFFERNDAANAWLRRLDLARRHVPEAGWPEFDADAWRELVALACHGKRDEEAARRAASVGLLQTRLTYAQNRRLDDEAPEALAVPSGSRIRLDYPPEGDGPPVLAARLQELFGWTATPRICGGRVAVLIHLLGPNHRPVQITDDLASFWANAYFQVRKDLRARYPKHSWPDDPLAAPATARGGRCPPPTSG